jgi:uncharacterized protein (UPF0332 family)
VGIADELLRRAKHLAQYEEHASQAALRRAISTAYYALFHLLITDASSRWNGTAEARTAMQRAFQHGSMMSASRQFSKRGWADWHGTRHDVPPSIQSVAALFVTLQEERHSADYDSNRRWTDTEVQELLDQTFLEFVSWHSIRHVPMAGNYLMAMFLGKQR